MLVMRGGARHASQSQLDLIRAPYVLYGVHILTRYPLIRVPYVLYGVNVLTRYPLIRAHYVLYGNILTRYPL